MPRWQISDFGTPQNLIHVTRSKTIVFRNEFEPDLRADFDDFAENQKTRQH